MQKNCMATGSNRETTYEYMRDVTLLMLQVRELRVIDTAIARSRQMK